MTFPGTTNHGYPGPGTNSWVGGTVFFRFEIALLPSQTTGGLWDQALWDQGIWAGNLPQWVEVTADMLSANTSAGSEKFGTRVRDAIGVFRLDNSEGQYNPDFGADDPGELAIRPGRWVRFSVSAGQGFIPIFTGTIDSMSEDYDTAGDNIVTNLMCTSFGGLLSVNNPPALETPVGGGELTSDRITRILDAVNWYPQFRFIDVGVNTMLPSTLARTRYEEMQRAADAEGGSFFFDGQGGPTFHNQGYITSGVRPTTLQAQPGSGIPGEPEVIAVKSDWDAGRVHNDIQLAREGGAAVRVEDTTSQSLYGRRSYQRFDYEVENDTQVLGLANQLLAWRAYDKLSVDEITLWAPNVAAAQKMVNLQWGDLVRAFVVTNRGWGYAIDANVARIDWTVTTNDFTQTLRIVDRTIGAPPGTRGAYSDGYSDGYLIGIA